MLSPDLARAWIRLARLSIDAAWSCPQQQAMTPGEGRGTHKTRENERGGPELLTTKPH